MAKTAITDRPHHPDTPAQIYDVELFSFQSPSTDHFVDSSQLAVIRDDIRAVVRSAWDKKSEEAIDRQMRYIAGDDIIDIVRVKEGRDAGRIVAFHSYKLRELPEGAKLLYTHYSGVHKDYQGRNLRQLSSVPVIDSIQPDILAGSTASSSIYIGFQRIAAEKGYIMYPNKQLIVPAAIYGLGKRVLSAAFDENRISSLDERLVRTYQTPVSPSGRYFPLFDNPNMLHLGPTQAVLCLAVLLQFHEKLVA